MNGRSIVALATFLIFVILVALVFTHLGSKSKAYSLLLLAASLAGFFASKGPGRSN
jgi:hypothetical protein